MPQPLEEILADEMNILTIMDMTPLEFTLNQLSERAESPCATGNGVVSRDQLLVALREMAAADESCKRELLAKGWCTVVK
jgi:hypothetical protein